MNPSFNWSEEVPEASRDCSIARNINLHKCDVVCTVHHIAVC